MFSVSELTIEQDNRPLWQNFSFELPAGERLGISAPSGYGKTMLGRVLAGWQSCRQGRITLDGLPLPKRGYCPVQLVPQHPERTFNPFRTTGNALRDAWQPDDEQLARIALLRSLDPRTRVLIADEITAQLDPSVQRDIWQQLIHESRRRGLSIIIFSHQTALLEQISSRMMIASR